jgi:hypothetical protein
MAIVDALAHHRTASESYELENEWHYPVRRSKHLKLRKLRTCCSLGGRSGWSPGRGSLGGGPDRDALERAAIGWKPPGLLDDEER